MRKEFKTEDSDLFAVNYNAFTGRIKIEFHGQIATKKEKNKKVYVVQEGEETHSFYLNGNSFTGINIYYQKKFYFVTSGLAWYIYVIGLIPFVSTMLLGNIVISPNFYYVGGAIGGGISAFFSTLGIILCTLTEKKWVRIIILLASITINFFICYGIGNLIAKLLLELLV